MTQTERPTVELNRLAVLGLLASTAAAGLLFTPVFGLPALLLPVLLVVLVCYGCVELGARWPVLAPLRPVLALLAGLLALIESTLFPTTLAGLPTVDSLRGLLRGATEGWLLTLQSTWPARPDADQLLFVPLVVLLAAVLGVELLLRLRTPLAALLPSLAVVGLAQAYQALSGLTAVLAAAGYAAPAALLLWADRPSRAGQRTGGRRPTSRLSGVDIRLAAATLAAVVVGAIALGAIDPAGVAPYRLKDGQAAPLRQNRISNPLQEIAQRLGEPSQEVFRYRSDRPVDRWSLVALDSFDGANWTADAQLRRLGIQLQELPGSTTRSAEVQVRNLSGPWLPSQSTPLGVDGLAPLVDQSAGTLVLDQPNGPAPDRQYRLTWSEPEVDLGALGVGPVDTRAEGGLGGLGVVPPEIDQLAKDAVRGLRPTFETALQLERFLSKNYKVAVGGYRPTGNGWPQLRQFLTETKVGTSEQFAAAYVVLARLNGIPARLVVGYRGSTERDGDSYVVRNRDVMAWPEVAVAEAGWVPLEVAAQAGTSSAGGPPQSGLAGLAAAARGQLAPENELRPPQLPQPRKEAADTGTGARVLRQLGIGAAAVLAALLVGWLLGVPLAKAVRARNRRRRTGTDGVVGGWAEVCDRLRGHGVPYQIGMTPRELAEVVGPVAGERTTQSIIRLGRVLDMALWSGQPVSNSAVRRVWDEVGSVRLGLSGRPFSARLRAALDPRTLLPPTNHRRRTRWAAQLRRRLRLTRKQ